jgi:hypothetical protein
VIQTDQRGSARLSLRLRLTLAAVGLVLLAPLLVAAYLRPNPQGLGTHEQLGLPPCTFRGLFDMRCPSCGMTTSWAHAVRGQWVRAVRSNVGGALLAAMTMVAVPWSLLSAIRGRWFRRPPSDRLLATLAILVVVVMLMDWVCRLLPGRI